MDNVMQLVTDRIISQLEAGIIPWHKPWVAAGCGAFNRISGPDKPYSFMNQMLLSHSGEYASFDQWRKLGGHIRKGETSELVVFWKWPSMEEDSRTDQEEDTVNTKGTETKAKRRGPILKYYRVFHISQVDGVEPLPVEKKMFYTKPIERAESLFRGYVKSEGIRVNNELSDQAFYSPASDSIHLPMVEQYAHAEEAAATSFHESIHSTGHPKRLGRPGLQQVSFGSAAYSREELVAEIGSCALCNMLGIETDESFKNAAAYIDGWLRVLRTKGNYAVIVHAAAQADKAVRYFLEHAGTCKSEIAGCGSSEGGEAS